MADASRGSVFISPQGDVFYSPNSRRQLKVPTYIRYSNYPFRIHEASLDIFQSPRWWSDAFGYVAFIPLHPTFDDLIFTSLRSVVRHVVPINEGHFGLETNKVELWSDLEDLMILTAFYLKSMFSVQMIYPSMAPIAPSLFGFKSSFRTMRSAELRAIRARNWFMVWIAYLSFLVAQLDSTNKGGPDWFARLASANVPQVWLSSLQTSVVCDFSFLNLRVGAFLDVLNPTRHQPPVKWFIDHNVPVWYRWGPQQERLVASNDKLAYMRPPVELYQEATTLLMSDSVVNTYCYFGCRSFEKPYLPAVDTRDSVNGGLLNQAWNSDNEDYQMEEPQTSQFCPQTHGTSSRTTSPMTDMSNTFHSSLTTTILPPLAFSPAVSSTMPRGLTKNYTTFNAAQDAHLITKPWQSFFEDRAQRHERALAQESAATRKKRIQREQQPPVSNTTVYVWDWSLEEEVQLVRNKIEPGKNTKLEEILGSFSAAERVYDSFDNEWDCCEFFGDSGDEEEDRGGDEDDEVISLGDEEEGPSGEGVAHGQPASAVIAAEQKENEQFIQQRVDAYSKHPMHQPISVPADVHNMTVNLTLPSNSLDLVNHLCLSYGYVPPLPRPAVEPGPLSISNWNECLAHLGLRPNIHNSPIVGLAFHIIAFVRGLQTGSLETLADAWDVLDASYCSVGSSIRDVFDTIGGGWYLVKKSCLKDKENVNWRIALKEPLSCLFVLRLLKWDPESHTSSKLATILVKKGIHFHMLQPSEHRLISLGTVSITIPRRLEGYKFRPDDYLEYVAFVRKMLQGPRARAALLHGGIVGRLAKEHLGTEIVTAGPSSALETGQVKIFVGDGQQEVDYFDDELSEAEAKAICGLNYCPTGIHFCEYFVNIYS